MNMKEWIAEAKQRIEWNKEAISEWDEMSSCDSRWDSNAIPRLKKENVFLSQGIRLIQGEQS